MYILTKEALLFKGESFLAAGSKRGEYLNWTRVSVSKKAPRFMASKNFFKRQVFGSSTKDSFVRVYHRIILSVVIVEITFKKSEPLKSDNRFFR